MTLKCGSTARNILHFMTAHATASISTSNYSICRIVDSGNSQEMGACCTRAHLLGVEFCCRMKPNPCLVASVYSHVGLQRLRNGSTGGITNWRRFMYDLLTNEIHLGTKQTP